MEVGMCIYCGQYLGDYGECVTIECIGFTHKVEDKAKVKVNMKANLRLALYPKFNEGTLGETISSKPIVLNLVGDIDPELIKQYGMMKLSSELFRLEYEINGKIPHVRAHLEITE